MHQLFVTYPLLRPQPARVRLESLSSADYQRLVTACNAVIASDDYYEVRAWAVLAIALGCVTRTKEIRLLGIDGLDVSSWILHLIHMKGERTYGSPRSVPVALEWRAILCRYIALRADPRSVVAVLLLRYAAA